MRHQSEDSVLTASGRDCFDPRQATTSFAREPGESIAGRLTPMQAALQNYLRSHSGTTLSRQQLCQEVWRMNYYNSRTVDQTISVVRKHLSEDEAIVTVFGIGYRHERS